ncbi:MAG TPA: hypothetical protein VFP36_14825, partial [Usitatibacter sp.]|nr:hypothetical protein [Usitatibacter sp.]
MRRALLIAAAGAVWAVSAASVPLRIDGLGEYTVTRAGLLFGASVSLVVHVALFVAVAMVLSLLLTTVRRLGGSAH